MIRTLGQVKKLPLQKKGASFTLREEPFLPRL